LIFSYVNPETLPKTVRMTSEMVKMYDQHSSQALMIATANKYAYAQQTDDDYYRISLYNDTALLTYEINIHIVLDRGCNLYC